MCRPSEEIRQVGVRPEDGSFRDCGFRSCGYVPYVERDRMDNRCMCRCGLGERVAAYVVPTYFDASSPVPYTGTHRVRPVERCDAIHTLSTAMRLVASRLTAIPKESAVGGSQEDSLDDAFGRRRAELDQVFNSLPRPGTDEYWSRLQGGTDGEAVPLEVIARCLRERYIAHALSDAEQVFELVLSRIQRNVDHWAWKIAGQGSGSGRTQLKEDLEQQCFMKLWEELTQEGPTFLFERFHHALGRLQQHVAHDVMEQAGEWQRPGVAQSTRVPQRHVDSMHAEPQSEVDVPLADQIADPRAADAFDSAELSDLLDHVRALSPDQRTIVYDRYWREVPQAVTAAKLGTTDRTVRNRLQTILRELGQRYRGDKEDDRV